MRWSILYSAKPKEDLQSILEYISDGLFEPDTAAKQIRTIMGEISSLNEMPMRYRLYEVEPWASRGMRIFPIGKYVVLYQPDESASVVNIVRIMYGGRNIAEQLGE